MVMLNRAYAGAARLITESQVRPRPGVSLVKEAIRDRFSLYLLANKKLCDIENAERFAQQERANAMCG